MTAESLTNRWKVCHSDTEKAQCGTSLLQSVSSISYGRETRFPYYHRGETRINEPIKERISF